VLKAESGSLKANTTMRDKRPVDELSIEELERILAIKKREERQRKLKRMERAGRLVNNGKTQVRPAASSPRADESAPLPPPLEKVIPVRDAPRFEDELFADEHVERAEGGHFWRDFVNQALLLVEVLAVLGLVLLGYNMLMAIGRLEQETATAQQLAEDQRRATIPTIAPTPQLRLDEVVLPGGHTPPVAGQSQFNFAEIPPNLLPLVQSQILAPVINRPPPTAETALRLIIPEINVDHTIVQGVDWEALRLGIGQLPNGVTPADDSGNVILSAHNDIYSEIFRELDQLEPGDEFQIHTETQIYSYVITGWDVVEPNDVHVLNDRDGATATLISCYPYKVDDKRIVVFADRVDA
jgi:sortase A